MPLGLTLAISVLFGLIAVAFIVVALRNRRRAAASQQWPTAEGTVTAATIKIWKDRESGDSYEPKITYSYTVDGQQYQGDKIAFGTTRSHDRAGAEAVTARYAVGTPVAVSYDPANPKLAVLEPKSTGSNTVFLIVGVVFLIVAIVFPILAS